MFSMLPESGGRRVRRQGGAPGSLVAHLAAVAALLYASAEAAPPRPAMRRETVLYRATRERPEPEAPPPEIVAAPPPVRAVTVLVPPMLVPDVLPGIDLQRAPSGDEAPILPRAFAEPLPVQPRAADPGVVLTPEEVEQPAVAVPGSSPPAYPEALRRAGVEGEVLASFVVDTVGRADMGTFVVQRATHELFSRAVREAVSRQRFVPARVGGRPVRQLVLQPFAFTIVP